VLLDVPESTVIGMDQQVLRRNFKLIDLRNPPPPPLTTHVLLFLLADFQGWT